MPASLASVLLASSVAACRPGEPVVAIAPHAPTTVDDLVATPAPPEGELWTWEWRLDGERVDDLPGDRVPAARTAKGQAWSVSVVRHRGAHASHPVDDEVVVGNAAPTVQVRLLPDPPLAEADLIASADAVDPDGDPIDLSYAWTVDGVVSDVVTATVPAAAIHGGQHWEVRVTASDGQASGIGTADATAGNTAPRITSARIEPSLPTETDTLSVVWTAADYDDDPVTVDVTWSVDGVDVATGDTLGPAYFGRDDVVRAVLVPTDGRSHGVPTDAGEVVVVNTPPSASGATVVPSGLTEGTIATCVLDGADDLDGDVVSADVRWFVGGTLAGTGPALTGAAFNEGDPVACEATPFDGASLGEPQLSSQVTVGNTPPVIGGVTLEPAAPTSADVVSAIAAPLYDVDVGDTEITVSVAWYVDGLLVGTAPTWSGAPRGSILEAVVTASDGDEDSVPVSSPAVVVANGPAVAAGLAMAPSAPTSNDDVDAITTISDPDGDPVDVSITWYVDAIARAMGPTFPAGLAQRDQSLSFVVTVDDGQGPIDVPSAAVVVGNGAPSLGAVAISPATLTAASTATCTPSGGDDPDGDPVTYAVLWWIDGIDAGTGPTLAGFGAGDVVRCQLTPTDGEAVGAAVWSAPVIVQ